MPDTDKQKIIAKVRALRSLADNNPSAEESKRAREAASKLMAKYKITEDDLKPPVQTPVEEIRVAGQAWAGDDPIKQMISTAGSSILDNYFNGMAQGKVPSWKELIREAIRDAVSLTDKEKK